MRSRVGLYLGFAATGVGAAMPGALLPLLLRRWSLGDARGGLLLFCYFLANTTGALVSRGAMNRSMARGALFTSAGAVWLAFASRAWGFAAIAVYGLGLGIAMTSTSLLVSRRFAEERRVEMMRLNLLWAAGACVAPWLGLGGRALRAGGATRSLQALGGIAAFFAAWAVWSWLAEGKSAVVSGVVVEFANDGAIAAEERHDSVRTRIASLAIPLSLLILVFCATGVESATSGWLAAYAQRLGATKDTTIGAATALWAGLLASRVVHSISRSMRFGDRLLLVTSTALMAVGLGVLVAWPGGMISVAAAFAVGFGAGPVYPLLLAVVLRRRETRGVFVLAGMGAAALPLVTGAVSGWTHSLAAGLCVPLAAAAAMGVLAWTVRADAAQSAS
jgi:MFS transporter, FHS family, glucose/mannose:H+ symporter